MTATTANHPHQTDQDRFCHLRSLGLDFCRFFDVGASNGCWSWRLSEQFPEATFELFEPLLDAVPAYRQRMNAVLAHRPNFRVHQFALGAECRQAQIYIPARPWGSTTLPLANHAPTDWHTLQVEMLTLDSVVEALQLPPPQALKIDAQGSELDILKGASRTLPQIDVLLLECWLSRDYGHLTPLLGELTNWLKDFDFYLWDFGDPCRDERGILLTQDCFFLNARSKISRLGPELASIPHPPSQPALGGWVNRLRTLITSS